MGGIAFFSSLLSLIYFGVLNSYFLLSIFSLPGLYNFGIFICVGTLGIWIASKLIRNEISVLIHELKHSIISNLVGNKAKGFMIRKDHGHFKYQYCPTKAHYNALIALAPYFLPLFTAPGLIMVYIILQKSFIYALCLLGFLWGIDFRLNTRDIAPYQSDFYNLNGGYKVGLIFTIAMNLTITTLILSWVLDPAQGLKIIFLRHFETMQKIFYFFYD